MLRRAPGHEKRPVGQDGRVVVGPSEGRREGRRGRRSGARGVHARRTAQGVARGAAVIDAAGENDQIGPQLGGGAPRARGELSCPHERRGAAAGQVEQGRALVPAGPEDLAGGRHVGRGEGPVERGVTDRVPGGDVDALQRAPSTAGEALGAEGASPARVRSSQREQGSVSEREGRRPSDGPTPTRPSWPTGRFS